jgi:predicted nucleic acid-binding protein
MNVLVDTSVWSLAYRRAEADWNGTEQRQKSELAELIREGRIRVIGPVCQELLSGIKSASKFELIRSDLRSFEQERLTPSDFERAAELSNALRTKGISGSPIDCLICAVAIDRGMEVFTSDEDFQHYAKHLPLRLHGPR